MRHHTFLGYQSIGLLLGSYHNGRRWPQGEWCCSPSERWKYVRHGPITSVISIGVHIIILEKDYWRMRTLSKTKVWSYLFGNLWHMLRCSTRIQVVPKATWSCFIIFLTVSNSGYLLPSKHKQLYVGEVWRCTLPTKDFYANNVLSPTTRSVSESTVRPAGLQWATEEPQKIAGYSPSSPPLPPKKNWVNDNQTFMPRWSYHPSDREDPCHRQRPRAA